MLFKKPSQPPPAQHVGARMLASEVRTDRAIRHWRGPQLSSSLCRERGRSPAAVEPTASPAIARAGSTDDHRQESQQPRHPSVLGRRTESVDARRQNCARQQCPSRRGPTVVVAAGALTLAGRACADYVTHHYWGPSSSSQCRLLLPELVLVAAVMARTLASRSGTDSVVRCCQGKKHRRSPAGVALTVSSVTTRVNQARTLAGSSRADRVLRHCWRPACSPSRLALPWPVGQ